MKRTALMLIATVVAILSMAATKKTVAVIPIDTEIGSGSGRYL